MKQIINVTVEPSTEPLTTAEAKLHLGLDASVTDFDARIVQLIAAARRRFESYTNRRLITQTLAIYLDNWPRGKTIEFPVAPISAVATVKYYDADDVQQTLSSANYVTDFISEPGRLVLIDGETWPDLKTGRPNRIEITVTAGYGAASDVPEGILTAMLMMIEKGFDRPDDKYMNAIDRVLTNEMSGYQLRRFL